MRKIFLFNMLSLDGFFEGSNKEISWHTVDEEFNEFAGHQLDEVDLLLFGRVTYERMASYWPTEIALKNDSIIAHKMNTLQKLFFQKLCKRSIGIIQES